MRYDIDTFKRLVYYTHELFVNTYCFTNILSSVVCLPFKYTIKSTVQLNFSNKTFKKNCSSGKKYCCLK